MDKYGQALINSASKLDAVTDACGEITKMANAIVEDNSKAATITLLKKISDTVDSLKQQVEIKKLVQLVNSNLISYYGYNTLREICKPESTISEDDKSLEELLAELDSLVGLESVKSKVNDLIAYQKVQKLRREKGLYSAKNTLHLAFTGNPGTGKTTVARIIGRIYKKIGLLSKGHFVEVSRTDLIAGYQGQTALKVKKVINRARGGVLFIDEAYSITENDHSDSYGRECLTELTKALEDYRDDLVVIVAGYTVPMEKFFDSNPGLKSRFNSFIEFPDYDVKELKEILNTICTANDYVLDDMTKEKTTDFFQKKISEKEDNFANGRMVRNLYDDLVMNHAKRVVSMTNPSKEELSTIKIEDFFPTAEK
ncbi:AAA family ATPase [Intestinibacter sp.]